MVTLREAKLDPEVDRVSNQGALCVTGFGIPGISNVGPFTLAAVIECILSIV